MSRSDEECAANLLETVPMVMRAIRREMRRQSGAEMSVPMFRAFSFLSRHPGASLSDVADHLGLARPTACTMIDGLVNRGLVRRVTSPDDRRRIELTLTPAGQDTYRFAQAHTRSRLAEMLAALPPEQHAQVSQAMSALRAVFGAETDDQTGSIHQEK